MKLPLSTALLALAACSPGPEFEPCDFSDIPRGCVFLDATCESIECEEPREPQWTPIDGFICENYSPELRGSGTVYESGGSIDTPGDISFLCVGSYTRIVHRTYLEEVRLRYDFEWVGGGVDWVAFVTVEAMR